MQRQEVVVKLPKDAYRALERKADRDDRSVEQQATYLLRRALENTAEGERVAAR